MARADRQGCHVDPAYLCRLFGRYDHQSPYQFLLRLKMNLAAERLQDPAALVKQVAAESALPTPFTSRGPSKKCWACRRKGFAG